MKLDSSCKTAGINRDIDPQMSEMFQKSVVELEEATGVDLTQ